MNPYEVLGVSKDADAQTIKNIWRAEASKAHPDREGGDPKRMAELNQAYAILSDPVKRKQFDATGSLHHRDDTTRLMTELAGLLLQVIENCHDVTRIDIVAEMEKALNNGIQQNQFNMAKMQAQIDKREAVVKRLGLKKGKKGRENMLSAMVQADVAQKKAQLAMAEGFISQGRELLKLLSDYRYKFDDLMQPTQPTMMRFVTTSTGTRNF